MKAAVLPTIACRRLCCLICLGLVMFLTIPNSYDLRSSRFGGKSDWLFRIVKGVRMNVTRPVRRLYPEAVASAPKFSPFVLRKGTKLGEDLPSSLASKSWYRSTDIKTVAYYDPRNEQPTLMMTDFSSCPFSSCRMTRDLINADVLIFLATKLKRTDAPHFRRKANQIWVFKTDEAPSRFSWFESLDRPGLRDVMNWTMTHKLNSDIPTPYGKLIEREEPPVKDYDAIFEAKTETAAWFVSHCPVRSRRMIYVERMRRRLDIDIFGKCGDKVCGMAERVRGVSHLRRQADNETCFPMLSTSYKFYLAFENSLCQDYITEKFFKLFQGVDVVPVVRGGADFRKYFPTGLFVDASDFAEPEDLADYLVDLARDKDRYIQYLKNKDKYQLVAGVTEWQCYLCRAIHTKKPTKTYPNIRSWFTENSCHDPMDSLDF